MGKLKKNPQELGRWVNSTFQVFYRVSSFGLEMFSMTRLSDLTRGALAPDPTDTVTPRPPPLEIQRGPDDVRVQDREEPPGAGPGAHGGPDGRPGGADRRQDQAQVCPRVCREERFGPVPRSNIYEAEDGDWREVKVLTVNGAQVREDRTWDRRQEGGKYRNTGYIYNL